MMPEVDGRKDFVSWSDVNEMWRWLEQGYKVEIRLTSRVNCPVGEQWLKMYCELHVWDTDWEVVPLPQRQLGSFPNAASKTFPGMLLGMLFALDSTLGTVRTFVEPTIAAQPRRLER